MTAAAEVASIGPEGTLSGAKQMTATHRHMKVPPSYPTHLDQTPLHQLTVNEALGPAAEALTTRQLNNTSQLGLWASSPVVSALAR